MHVTKIVSSACLPLTRVQRRVTWDAERGMRSVA